MGENSHLDLIENQLCQFRFRQIFNQLTSHLVWLLIQNMANWIFFLLLSFAALVARLALVVDLLEIPKDDILQ